MDPKKRLLSWMKQHWQKHSSMACRPGIPDLSRFVWFTGQLTALGLIPRISGLRDFSRQFMASAVPLAGRAASEMEARSSSTRLSRFSLTRATQYCWKRECLGLYFLSIIRLLTDFIVLPIREFRDYEP